MAQVVCLPLLESGQPNLDQRFFHARGNFGFGQAELLRAESHVLRHRRTKQLVVRVLKHQPNLTADLLQIFGRNRLAINFHRAIAGEFFRQQAVQMQQQGGFAGTVWAEQRDALAGQHAEADAAQGFRAVAVAVFQIGDFDSVHVTSNRAHTWRCKSVPPVPMPARIVVPTPTTAPAIETAVRA